MYLKACLWGQEGKNSQTVYPGTHGRTGALAQSMGQQLAGTKDGRGNTPGTAHLPTMCTHLLVNLRNATNGFVESQHSF